MSFRKSVATEKSPQIQHCGNCYIITKIKAIHCSKRNGLLYHFQRSFAYAQDDKVFTILSE